MLFHSVVRQGIFRSLRTFQEQDALRTFQDALRTPPEHSMGRSKNMYFQKVKSTAHPPIIGA